MPAGSGDGCAASGKGYTTIIVDASDSDYINVTTQYDDDDTEDVMTNKVEVE